MTNDPSDADPSTPSFGRRGLVGGLAIGSIAVGAGAVAGFGASKAAGASGMRRSRLTFEVACLGATWRESSRANAANDADYRVSFGVEGFVYPVGTILGDGFVATADASIGHWFCRGFQLIDGSRGEPHAQSHQDFLFGAIRPDDLFPRDTLASSGVEGTLARDQTAVRAVVGGTGEYFAAAGEQRQTLIATNTSVFADGTNDPSPCWRIEFDLRLFD